MDSKFLHASIDVPITRLVAHIGHVVLNGFVSTGINDRVPGFRKYRSAIDHDRCRVNQPIDNPPLYYRSIARVVFSARLADGRLGDRHRIPQGPIRHAPAVVSFQFSVEPIESVVN